MQLDNQGWRTNFDPFYRFVIRFSKARMDAPILNNTRLLSMQQSKDPARLLGKVSTVRQKYLNLSVPWKIHTRRAHVVSHGRRSWIIERSRICQVVDSALHFQTHSHRHTSTDSSSAESASSSSINTASSIDISREWWRACMV